MYCVLVFLHIFITRLFQAIKSIRYKSHAIFRLRRDSLNHVKPVDVTMHVRPLVDLLVQVHECRASFLQDLHFELPLQGFLLVTQTLT